MSGLVCFLCGLGLGLIAGFVLVTIIAFRIAFKDFNDLSM